jgi:putative component of toxin-antitoxin plasmid stabilization module
MFHIEKTNEFNKWLRKLKDFKAKDGKVIVLLIGGDKST